MCTFLLEDLWDDHWTRWQVHAAFPRLLSSFCIRQQVAMPSHNCANADSQETRDAEDAMYNLDRSVVNGREISVRPAQGLKRVGRAFTGTTQGADSRAEGTSWQRGIGVGGVLLGKTGTAMAVCGCTARLALPGPIHNRSPGDMLMPQVTFSREGRKTPRDMMRIESKTKGGELRGVSESAVDQTGRRGTRCIDVKSGFKNADL